MEKRFTEFDEAVRNGMEGYEFPYDSGSWSALEKRLSSEKDRNNKLRNALLVAAGLLLCSGVWWLLSENSPLDQRQGFLALRANLTNPDVSAYNEFGTNQSRNGRSSSFSSGSSEIGTKDFKQGVSNTGTSNRNDLDIAASENPASSSSKSADVKASNGGKKAADSAELVLMPTKREACVSEVVGFGINISFEGTEKFLWNFGDGTFSNQPNPSHKYAKPGTYDVSLSVTSTADGVIRSRVMERLVVVYPKPSAKFDWEFLNKSHEPTRVKFVNKSESANKSQWFVDDSPLGSHISPVSEFTEKGDHTIKLTVINEYGCSDDLYKYLKIESDYKLLASDKCSIGEGFMPKALKLMKRPFKMMIFDGNNQTVYETTDINKPWNCTLTNGNTAPVDSQFTWAVTLIDESGQEKVYGGTITLIP